MGNLISLLRFVYFNTRNRDYKQCHDHIDVGFLFQKIHKRCRKIIYKTDIINIIFVKVTQII